MKEQLLERVRLNTHQVLTDNLVVESRVKALAVKLKEQKLEKVRFNSEVTELKDIILTKINKDSELIFTFTNNFNSDIFCEAIREIEKVGFIVTMNNKKSYINIYSEDYTLQGTVKYNIDQNCYINNLERPRLEKIDELEVLNSRFQELVNRSKIVTYPEKPFLKSFQPVRPYAKKGDLKEAFTLLCKILKLSYEVEIKIPRQQRKLRK